MSLGQAALMIGIVFTVVQVFGLLMCLASMQMVDNRGLFTRPTALGKRLEKLGGYVMIVGIGGAVISLAIWMISLILRG